MKKDIHTLLSLLLYYRDIGFSHSLCGAQKAEALEPRHLGAKNHSKNVSTVCYNDAITSETRALWETVQHYQLLDTLEQAVKAFDQCTLKRYAKNTVFASGTTENGLMVIGEAPGAEEDATGVPLCGASGKLLNKMLSAIYVEREKTYVTNTIFWRPEKNRKPTPQELSLCAPFTCKHIALVNPKLLLLLGSTAANSLIDPKTRITDLRLKVFDYKNRYMEAPIKTVVTYHPSFLLRTPMQKSKAWADLLFIKKILANQSNVTKKTFAHSSKSISSG